MTDQRRINQRRVKDIVLHISKRLGLFRLARLLTRRGLRILCYHGFELDDETSVRPKLFVRMADFEKRMAMLAAGRYPVLSLNEALHRLGHGSLPPSSVVITIDDGFHSVRTAAAILKRFEFPATVYVTTYYVEKHAPIFRLAIGYMFAKAPRMRIECNRRPWLPSGELRLDDADARARQLDEIISYGERRCTEDGRQRICRELATLLLADYGRLRRTRLLSLMDRQELVEMKQFGVDVQLHTHRHRFPSDDKRAAQTEIVDNRRVLVEMLGNKPLEHLCYPSGVYDPLQWEWLTELGVRSATTCETGLNYADTPRLGLRRFLDDSLVSPITFEAEMSGFLEIARRCRAWMGLGGRSATNIFSRDPRRAPRDAVHPGTWPKPTLDERVAGHSRAELT